MTSIKSTACALSTWCASTSLSAHAHAAVCDCSAGRVHTFACSRDDAAAIGSLLVFAVRLVQP